MKYGDTIPISKKIGMVSPYFSSSFVSYLVSFYGGGVRVTRDSATLVTNARNPLAAAKL